MTRTSIAILTLVVLSGCTDLQRFRTDDILFEGEITGIDASDCPAEPCSFVRRGFAGGTMLTLDFDPEEAESSPGSLTTDGEPCGRTFDNTPLRSIAPMLHDPLSLYDFPGGGRLRNYMFSARPETGPLSGRDVMVFVSLMRGDRVEVRVLAGDGSRVCDPSDCSATSACDYFGVFELTRPR